MNSTKLRPPVAADGPQLAQLVRDCPPLDVNSRYCNLLQVTHFRETAVVAEQDGKLVGFITGYRLPDDPTTLFVWQVGVAPEGRGQGLALKMLLNLIERQDGVVRVHTTVTPGNEASRRMFANLAEALNTQMRETVMFSSTEHFEGQHEDEMLFDIGPFTQPSTQSPTQPSTQLEKAGQAQPTRQLRSIS